MVFNGLLLFLRKSNRVSSQIRLFLIFLLKISLFLIFFLKISLFLGSGEAFCIFYKKFRRDPGNNDIFKRKYKNNLFYHETLTSYFQPSRKGKTYPSVYSRISPKRITFDNLSNFPIFFSVFCSRKGPERINDTHDTL